MDDGAGLTDKPVGGKRAADHSSNRQLTAAASTGLRDSKARGAGVMALGEKLLRTGITLTGPGIVERRSDNLLSTGLFGGPGSGFHPSSAGTDRLFALPGRAGHGRLAGDPPYFGSAGRPDHQIRRSLPLQICARRYPLVTPPMRGRHAFENAGDGLAAFRRRSTGPRPRWLWKRSSADCQIVWAYGKAHGQTAGLAELRARFRHEPAQLRRRTEETPLSFCCLRGH